MEPIETPPVQKHTAFIVLGLVVGGLVLVSVGGFLVWSKRGSAGAAERGSDAREIAQWCQLRKEWSKSVEPLVGDILLKSVSAEDKAERDKLVLKRNVVCQDFASKLRDLKLGDPVLGEAEVVLIKEGKTRANVSIEIDNLLTQIDAPDTTALRDARDKLDRYIKNRISEGRARADKELATTLAKFGDQNCTGFFRGPATDEGTSGNPYVSWDELELSRTGALKEFDAKIRRMEPVEQFTNRVYHELVRLYRPTLTKCYKRAKAKNPTIANELKLRVRLKQSGMVGTLADEESNPASEKLLECLLETAAKWRLPQPDPQARVVVVTLDFSRI